ncbi:hypothetical protein ABIT13_15415, partial [Limnospira fusiformis NRMCF6962]
TNVSLINDSGDYVKGSSDMRFTTVFNESINSLDGLQKLYLIKFKYNELAAMDFLHNKLKSV